MTKPAPFADTSGALAVRAGRLLDVESGEATPDRVLLVRDARIEAVLGPDDGLPDGTPVVDLSGLTVLPGLIDTHSHLVGEVQTAGVPATTTTGAQDALLSVRNARVTLEAGFTTVRDLGAFRAFADCALRDTINAGELEGPRMQCAGAFITVPWGGGDVVGLAPDIRLPERAPVRRRHLAGRGARAGAAAADRRRRRHQVHRHRCRPDTRRRARVPPSCPRRRSGRRSRRPRTTTGSWPSTRTAPRARGGRSGPGRAPWSTARCWTGTPSRCSPTPAPTWAWTCSTASGRSREGNAVGWPADTMRKLRETMDTGIAAFRWAVEAGVRITYSTDSGVYPHELVAQAARRRTCASG